jgi:hypothetical protein
VTEEAEMTGMKRWTVEILIGEVDQRTYAEAQLYDEISDTLIGTGTARLNPVDPGVPEIGDEIAVARALTDLGQRLLSTASRDLETVTSEKVLLTR